VSLVLRLPWVLGVRRLPSLTEPDSQADLDTRRSEMLADNRLTRITGLIRGVGIFVVFLIALAGVPQSGAGEEGSGCYDYTIFTCMNEDDCLEDAGQACGERLTGCAGAGYLACAHMTGCANPENNVAKVCLFDDTMN
jgi:hypothetical protein